MNGIGNQRLTRRALLAGAASALAGAAWAEAPLRSLRPRARDVPQVVTGGPARPDDRLRARATIDDLIAEAGLSGITGVIVADAGTGAVLEERSSGETLPPASVTKSVTAMYALDALGAGHRFATRLLATGPVTDGVLDGDLILAGGGDPVLDTDALDALAQRLADAGVAEVTGTFRVWGGAIPELFQIDPVQKPHIGYNPAVSGLSLNFNRVHFEWAQTGGAYTVTMDARSGTLRPAVTTARMAVVDRAAPVYAYDDADGVDAWSVSRGALGTGGTRWLPVRRPAAYAGDVFRTLARSRGIVLGDPAVMDAVPEGTEIVRHESPRLDAIIRDMLLYSTNLTAEMIGLAASRARGEEATDLASSAAVMVDWLAQTHGIEGAFMDHSGLGTGSRIAPREMVRLLVIAQAQGTLRPLLRTIPMVDENRERLTDPPGDVVAKTGTLNFVSTLAGFVSTPHGADLAFVVFSADTDAREEAMDGSEDLPPGAATFNGRAKRLQQRLLQRWAVVFSGRAPAPAETVELETAPG